MGSPRCCGNLGWRNRPWTCLLQALQERQPGGNRPAGHDQRELDSGGKPFRLLQLSDPHLLGDPDGRHRGRQPLTEFRHGLAQARGQLPAAPDLLLISGDLCQDEGLSGYARLREALADWDSPLALLPGNHDHPALLAAALGRRATLAPAELRWGPWRILLLSSHRPAQLAGWLGASQLDWLAQCLSRSDGPVLVVLHHPPLPIGDPHFDAIGLRDAPALLELLARCPDLEAVLCGHVHQHWRGPLPGRPDVPLLACPSTLCAFPAVQPCPLGRPEDPGGRWLELEADGHWRQGLLRWSPALGKGAKAGRTD